VDEARLLEDGERVEQLRGKDLDELRAEAEELVLLDELVQVAAQELEHEAEVVLMDERVAEAEDVVLVAGVELVVEQLEDGDLHHRLVEVGRLVLHDLDGDDLVRFDVLAFDDLAEGALAEDVEDEVPAPASGSSRADEPIAPRTCSPPRPGSR
jgi:hypothetical protein